MFQDLVNLKSPFMLLHTDWNIWNTESTDFHLNAENTFRVGHSLWASDLAASREAQ